MLLGKFARNVINRINPLSDGSLLQLFRHRLKSGSFENTRNIRMGPNHVYAFVTRVDGTFEDLGLSENKMTNSGDFILGGGFTGQTVGSVGNPATATTATGFTVTGTPLTVSALATNPSLVGYRAFFPVTGVTTQPVYGNIMQVDTTSHCIVDKWWNPDDTTGTTPAATNAFSIVPGGIGGVRFMALSADAAAIAATDTTLPSEITTNALGRAKCSTISRGAFPSASSGTFTLTNAYSPSGTQASIQKVGLFMQLPSTPGAEPMIFEGTFTAASVANGDTLTVTDTITFAGP